MGYNVFTVITISLLLPVHHHHQHNQQCCHWLYKAALPYGQAKLLWKMGSREKWLIWQVVLIQFKVYLSKKCEEFMQASFTCNCDTWI